jgi:AcrR family transcriptional regulator
MRVGSRFAHSQHRPDEDRERISRALVDLVATEGYRSLTLPRLLERAEVEGMSFERHYKSLPDCFKSVWGDHAEQFLEMALAAIASEPLWRDQVRAVAVAALRFLQEDRNRATFMIVEAFHAGEEVQVLREQFIAPMAALIDAGRLELDDPTSISPATASAAAHSVLTRIRVEITIGNGDRLEQLAPQMVFSLLQPYIGSEAAIEAMELPRAGV